MTRKLVAVAVAMLLATPALAGDKLTTKSTSEAKCQTMCDGRTLSDYNIQKE